MAVPKFGVGDTVRFAPDRGQLNPAPGQFKILRLMPEEAGIFQYRVKNGVDGQERLAREDQLTRS